MKGQGTILSADSILKDNLLYLTVVAYKWRNFTATAYADSTDVRMLVNVQPARRGILGRIRPSDLLNCCDTFRA